MAFEDYKAGQVPRERIYGNFKPDRFKHTVEPQGWRKPEKQRPGMSAAHLYLIRQLPCAVCERRAGESHHLKSLGAAHERGIGMKATDRWAVPLCGPFGHHLELEQLGSRREPGWFWEFGINPHALAHALWANSGDLSRMNRVMLAHKLAASAELLDRKLRRRR